MRPLERDDPDRVGGYTLLARLGAGGMGRVYLGRSVTGQDAAIKVVRPELAEDDTFRNRFRQEVAAAVRVTGPATARVLAADPDAALPWLATQYVPGPSLAAAVAEHGPLPDAALRTLAVGLAEALIAVHAAGIVHRDLKPSNVILAERGPVVIDFGIARAAEATALTGTGQIVGTPGYLAPEQLQGNQVGPAADVFALGALLVFAATGRPAFGDGPTAGLLWRAVHGRPSLDGVPAAIAEHAAACLRVEPAARPTPAELAAALRPAGTTRVWLSPDQLARAPVPPRPLGRRKDRRRMAVAAAAALVAGLAVTGYLAANGWPTTPAPQPVSPVPAPRAAPYSYDPATGACRPAWQPWPDARWLTTGTDRVRAGEALPLELRDKFGPTGDYTYPLPVTIRVYAPDGTSTLATTNMRERDGTGVADAVWPGSFTGAPSAYPAGAYTVLWYSGDRLLACHGITAV